MDENDLKLAQEDMKKWEEPEQEETNDDYDDLGEIDREYEAYRDRED